MSQFKVPRPTQADYEADQRAQQREVERLRQEIQALRQQSQMGRSSGVTVVSTAVSAQPAKSDNKIVTLDMPGGILVNGSTGPVTGSQFQASLAVTGMLKGLDGDFVAAVPYTDYEPGLGYPLGSGYVLTSTTDGIRSWQPPPTSGGGSSLLGPAMYVSDTSGSLVPLALENRSVDLGKLCVVFRAYTSAAAWVRVYSSNGARLADTGRGYRTDPTGEHGVLLEFITYTGNLTLDLSPFTWLRSLEEPTTSTLPMVVYNLSSVNQSIRVGFDRIVGEG